MISNLVGNSVKYSPFGSEIQIRSTKEFWEIKNSVEQTSTINWDTIFDPFVSYDLKEDEYEKSHGLGLYFVDAILKQYDYKYECYVDDKKQEFVFRILM